ncbi:hypothetical protein [Demequina litorisediminis]|uniref:hypothetical protein n=1 Tax=Demequina litorisediminis TaxID=1849022 RepID=UPI0024E0471C|nr:hypothetical protein [Demequina litorisediminis]
MGELPGPWRALLDEARLYPSPHNSQPVRVRVTGERSAEVFYDLDRGLPAENFGIPFGHVCAGVFLEGLQTVAAGHGWAVTTDLHLTEMDFDAEDRLHRIATVTLSAHTPGPLEPVPPRGLPGAPHQPQALRGPCRARGGSRRRRGRGIGRGSYLRRHLRPRPGGVHHPGQSGDPVRRPSPRCRARGDHGMAAILRARGGGPR